jgi:hypothetical protein
MRILQLFAEGAHGEFGQRLLQHTDWPERGRETRLMRSVVQIGQQERLREQCEFDRAANDVLAKAVDDSQPKTLLTKELNASGCSCNQLSLRRKSATAAWTSTAAAEAQSTRKVSGRCGLLGAELGGLFQLSLQPIGPGVGEGARHDVPSSIAKGFGSRPQGPGCRAPAMLPQYTYASSVGRMPQRAAIHAVSRGMAQLIYSAEPSKDLVPTGWHLGRHF